LRALSDPDEHNSGENTEHQADQELVNAVTGKRDARPEDHGDHGDEPVADRRTEQEQGRCRKGSEGDM
jgi:hypothetical protein